MLNHTPHVWRFLLIAAILIALRTTMHGAGTHPPNIVIILADDLGWSDLSCYGARDIETPVLDGLAAEGIRFTDFYVPSPVCTPSRAALITGRYPARTGLETVLTARSTEGISAQEVTLAEKLKEGGYATGLFGKWHLGRLTEHLPLQHGFDEYFGIPYSNDMKPLLFLEGNDIVPDEVPVQAHLISSYTRRAIAFIHRQQSQPFFLLLAHSMPHYPIDVTGKWKGSSRAGIYGDVIQQLDSSVGEIMNALQELDLDGRTAVFFTSDNGSWRPASSGVLRGRKTTTWEGGVRVPLIMRFPGVFPAHRTWTQPVMALDLFPTIVAMAGLEPLEDRIIDGRNLLPELTENRLEISKSSQPHRSLFFFQQGVLCAVRSGPWKLHLARKSLLRKDWIIPPELYNLENDPGETQDLASQKPEVVRRLTKEAALFETGL